LEELGWFNLRLLSDFINFLSLKVGIIVGGVSLRKRIVLALNSRSQVEISIALTVGFLIVGNRGHLSF
jgi:hypothetical protein